jgi:hypothetical protein
VGRVLQVTGWMGVNTRAGTGQEAEVWTPTGYPRVVASTYTLGYIVLERTVFICLTLVGDRRRYIRLARNSQVIYNRPDQLD